LMLASAADVRKAYSKQTDLALASHR
jgi:hypothetical protein